MKEQKYSAGDIILKEGDPSDFACEILSGEVEIFTEFYGDTVILGVMKAKEFLGEMGLIDGQPRSASARAKSQVSLRFFEKKEFFRLISKDSSSAYRMITRLCEQNRAITRRLTEVSSTMDIGDAIMPELKSKPASYRFAIFPASPRLAETMPKEGIVIKSFPFSVGRLLKKKELEPHWLIDLKIKDKPPFRLSRQHFALDQQLGGFCIVDLGSDFGTEVNGEFLGRNFGKDFEYLKPGENKIIAGGLDSPFIFKVLAESV